MKAKEFLLKQNILQNDSNTVLKKLGLIEILSSFGKVELVGSLSLGLMTWSDIDIDLVSYKEINKIDYLKMVDALLSKKGVNRLILIDNRSAFEKNRPKSMYLGIIYDYKGVEWKIDIRYLNASSAYAKNDLKLIKSKLNSENRGKILEIKTKICNHSLYGKDFEGYDVYSAVLDRGVGSVEEFWEFLKKAERG